MSDIQQIAESVPFSAKDIKGINAARQQCAEINATINKVLADSTHAPYDVGYSWLHHEIDRLEQVLIDWPTHENSEIFHAAIIRLEEAKITQNRVSGALCIAAQKVSQSVAGIVAGLFDKVQSRIGAEADTRRAELAATRHGLFNNSDETRALELRVAQLMADLANERQVAAQDPLAWLERHGLAMDGQPEDGGTEAA